MLSLLSEPACGLVENLTIDHDYIEALPAGTCFNIPQKTLEWRPRMDGTPRVFVHYIYGEYCVPFPQRSISGKLRCNHTRIHRQQKISFTRKITKYYFSTDSKRK